MIVRMVEGSIPFRLRAQSANLVRAASWESVVSATVRE
jgi:hypothetical protein